MYRPGGSLAVGSLNFEGLHVADFDGDGRDDLLIAGSDRFGVLQTGSKGQRLKTIASYESKRNEARLSDLAAGDVNADGVPDVVFTDIAEQMLEIATYAGEKDLLHAITFKVFERKIFRGVGDMIEPRDQVIGDVDGDGRDDLVLIAHDRVLVLRQDPGTARQETTAGCNQACIDRSLSICCFTEVPNSSNTYRITQSPVRAFRLTVRLHRNSRISQKSLKLACRACR